MAEGTSGATFEVQVITPKVPETLTIKLPTQTKGSPTPPGRFTDAQLDAVVADFGAKLKAKAAEQRAQEAGETETGDDAETEAPKRGRGRGRAAAASSEGGEGGEAEA